MEKINLSIFVPCYNEEKNIIKALNNIKESVQNINYEILIADDCSTDQSVQIIKKFINDNRGLNIHLFCNKKNQGLGFNYYAMAYKAIGKYYMIINGDAVEPQNTIKKMVSNIDKADMILTNFGKKDKRKLIRRFISRTFVAIINIITFNNMKYYNGPAIHLTENVKLYGTGAFGFGYQAELICVLITNQKTYIEIEIENTDRHEGETQAFTIHNILSVGRSIIMIFINQISYLAKIIFK